MKQTSQISWRVPGLAWIPLGAAVLAEAASNALRALDLGRHLPGLAVSVAGYTVPIAGAVLGVAAVALAFGQARAVWLAFAPGVVPRQRIVAIIAAAILLAISTTSVALHVLDAQRIANGHASGDRGTYDRAVADHAKATAELETLAAVRSTTDVQAAMGADPIPRAVFARTKQCTEVSRDDSLAACRGILALRVEMGKAIRKADLERETKRIDAVLAGMKPAEAATAIERAVATGWAWLFAFGLVGLASFGSVIFARAETVPVVTAADRPLKAAAVKAPALPAPAVPLAALPAPSPVLIALRKAGRPLTNAELARALGVSEGEATKARRRVADQIIETRDGRRVLISAV